MMRPKQKPFFSILEEMELDISASDKENIRLPDARIAEVPEPVAAEPAAAGFVPPIPAPPRKSEPIAFSGEKDNAGLPSEEPRPKIVVEPVAPEPTAAVTSVPISEPVRKIAVGVDEVHFVYITPGSFIMGSPESEPGRGADEIQHEVTLTQGYHIQATPVTQGQWKAVMGSNPASFQQAGEDCPVEGVSWNDCQEFIRRVNNTGPYLYRLPTEAEWEYACRAGSSTAFFSGDISKKLFSRKDPCLDAIGWYSGNSDKKTHPVAQKKPNAWGVFDMHGNVFEWCRDWYRKYAAKPQVDPPGPAFGPGCVVRGGSWSSNSQNCRSAARFYRGPGLRSNFVGFRLVRESKNRS